MKSYRVEDLTCVSDCGMSSTQVAQHAALRYATLASLNCSVLPSTNATCTRLDCKDTKDAKDYCAFNVIRNNSKSYISPRFAAY